MKIDSNISNSSVSEISTIISRIVDWFWDSNKMISKLLLVIPFIKISFGISFYKGGLGVLDITLSLFNKVIFGVLFISKIIIAIMLIRQ